MAKQKGPESVSPKRTEYNVPAEQFIKVWQQSDTAEQVAEALGMPVPIVHARASNYRKAGVKLKNMQRPGRKAIDVDRLNRLIDNIGSSGQSSDDESPVSREDLRRVLGEVMYEQVMKALNH